MAEFGDRILYTPAWDAFHAVAVMVGLASIIVLLFGIAESRRAKLLAWSGVGLLLVSAGVSMVFEEIVPAWPTLAAARRVPYALSFPGFLVFIVLFVYSGQRLIKGGLYTYFPLLFRRGPDRAEAVRALRPGALLFGASAAVFAVSLLGYHGLDVILGRPT